MNSSQRLVATMGLILILLVLWTTYKPTIKSILFDAPASSGGSDGGGGIFGSPKLPLIPGIPVIPGAPSIGPFQVGFQQFTTNDVGSINGTAVVVPA